MENLSDQEVDSGDKEYMTDSRTENQNRNSDSSSPVVIENMNRNQNSPSVENAALFDEIVKMLKRMDREPGVILLIGPSGVGKSSVINTIHRVLSGQKFCPAPHGSGIANSDTLDLERYDNCGIDQGNIKDDCRGQKIMEIFQKLPHFIDWCGFGDVDSTGQHEILELLIGGFLPRKTNITALLEKQRTIGVGNLKIIFRKANPADKVTQVVFIQSCRDNVPKNLIKCLTNILNMTDSRTLLRKYTAKMFLLITKYDLVRGTLVHQSSKRDSNSMTLKDFDDKEREIAEQLNIIGALEAYRIKWASYSDNITDNNEYIENYVLRFVKRMIQLGASKEVTGQPVDGVLKTLELFMLKLCDQIHVFLILMAVLAVFAVLLYELMSPY